MKNTIKRIKKGLPIVLKILFALTFFLSYVCIWGLIINQWLIAGVVGFIATLILVGAWLFGEGP